MEIIKEILNNRSQELSGKIIGRDEVGLLIEQLQIPNLIDILSILSEYPLCGCNFSTPEDTESMDYDESKIEIDFQWMDTSQILSEALDCYPCFMP